MFANAYQSGFLSLFYSVGNKPLQLWDKQVKNGHIRRVTDDDVKSLVLEIMGTNVATTFITTPIDPRGSLGIKLPFLVMIVKNLKKYFTFEIQILDDRNMHRRFRVSNFQSTTKVRPFCTTMPIGLSTGWNQIQFNLSDFTRRAYGSTYLETTRVQIHANVRIRRIYFSDRLYAEEEMPQDFKLYVPTPGKQEPYKQRGAKATPTKTEEAGEGPKEEKAAPADAGAVQPAKTASQTQSAGKRLSSLGEGAKPLEPRLSVTSKRSQPSAQAVLEDMAEVIPSGAPPTPTDEAQRGGDLSDINEEPSAPLESEPLTESEPAPARASMAAAADPRGSMAASVGRGSVAASVGRGSVAASQDQRGSVAVSAGGRSASMANDNQNIPVMEEEVELEAATTEPTTNEETEAPLTDEEKPDDEEMA